MRRKSDAALELMRKKDELVARRDEELDRLRSRVVEMEEALREVRTAAVTAVPEESKSSSTYCSSSLSDQTEEQLPLVLSRIRQLSGEQLSAFIEELFRKFFSQEKALLEQLRLLESEIKLLRCRESIITTEEEGDPSSSGPDLQRLLYLRQALCRLFQAKDHKEMDNLARVVCKILNVSEEEELLIMDSISRLFVPAIVANSTIESSWNNFTSWFT